MLFFLKKCVFTIEKTYKKRKSFLTCFYRALRKTDTGVRDMQTQFFSKNIGRVKNIRYLCAYLVVVRK